jgi:hypothetical protein
VVENLAASLERAGVSVYGQGNSPSQSSADNVVIVTGHRDINMARHLDYLKNEGALANKLVLIFSCYDHGVELAQSNLTAGKNGAIGVIYFADVINAPAVEAVMNEFALAIRSGQLFGLRLDRAVAMAGERARAKADPRDKSENQKILDGMTIQTSSVQRDALSQDWIA